MNRFETWETFATLRLERNEGAARITLDRESTLNAVIPGLGLDLTAALGLCGDEEIRAVSITGAGRAFWVPARWDDASS